MHLWLSSTYSVHEGLPELVAQFGSARFVCGSDAVFPEPASQLGRVLFVQIPVEAKRKHLGLNARRVPR